MNSAGVLLDTHAVLWLDSGQAMHDDALAAIEAARRRGGVLVSAVSGWEIGMLVRKRRISLVPDPGSWMGRFLAQPGIRHVPLSMDTAIASSALAEPFHGDPADRLLIATARELAVPLVTRDVRILAWAAAVGEPVIPC